MEFNQSIKIALLSIIFFGIGLDEAQNLFLSFGKHISYPHLIVLYQTHTENKPKVIHRYHNIDF